MVQEELQELLEVRSTSTYDTFTEAKYEVLKSLLHAVLDNETEQIEAALYNPNLGTNLLTYRYDDFNHLTILAVACAYDQVSADTLRALHRSLRQKYGTVDWTDDLWYGWEALHYLARAGNPRKLRALVDELENVDSLTYFSENALHILLEYGKSVAPVRLVLHNGVESKPCSLIVQERHETFKCAKILIDKGIDVNHANFWNESPICLAVKYRFFKVVELLLRTPGIDVDSCRVAGRSIREFLKLNNMSVGSLPPTDYYHEDPATILFGYLKSGDDTSFLSYNNENIKDYVDAVDGEDEHNTSGTMLQFCFRKGFMGYLECESYNKALVECDILKTPMLDVFKSKGQWRCIEHLLDNGADTSKATRKFPLPLLEAAAIKGYYPFVAILLQHKKSDVNTDDIFHILPRLFEEKLVTTNQDVYRSHVLYLLLNKLVEEHAHEFLTAKKRHILTRLLFRLNLEQDDTKPDDSAIICQLLILGASLTAKDESGKMVVERIHKNVLEEHLYDCVDTHLYYNSLVRDEDNLYSETKALHVLSKDSVKWELLNHPLMVNFINTKWSKIYWFFTSVLLFYGGFVVSVCLYMLSHHLGKEDRVIDVTFYLLLGFQIVKEAVQCVFLYRWGYFMSRSNYPELTVIISCVIYILQPNIYCMIISILFSTGIFFILLGQLPSFTKYTLILRSINYFLEYALFYLFMFVSFAICFYIIFPYNTPNTASRTNATVYQELTRSLFDTFIIFTGQIEDRVLQPELYPVFGRVVVTVFVFCMTIILNNLLVGMIVADMDEIQRDLTLYKHVKMSSFIVRTNSFAKRLHELKQFDCIKSVLNYINLFKRDKCKVIERECVQPRLLNELKRIKNRPRKAYDRQMLRKVYEAIRAD